MAEPFICPHCNSHDYTIVLTGCNITGATLQESLTWDEEEMQYVSPGTVIVESESVENESGQAICAGCDADVSEAVQQYEAAQESTGGDGCAE